MHRFILAAALVGVAVPAQAQDREGWAERRAARAEQRQQPESQGQQSDQVRPERPHQEQRVEQPRIEQPRIEQPRLDQPRLDQPRLEQSEVERPRLPPRADRPRIDWRDAHQGSDEQQGNGEREGWRRNGQRDGQQLPGRPREVQPQPGGEQWTGGQHQVPQPGGQGWNGQHPDSQRWASRPDDHRWTSNWQRDPRYDWQRYRARNRSIFSIGNYYDPFGWGYRRVNVGFTLYAGYYSRNYWIDDPWQYRLPPVYGPYRWVRYFDDAVLVDIYSGRAVEVIRNFFW